MAHYLPWFQNRIREGFCVTVNPFNPMQETRISLDPGMVRCIVFWSRDPGPLLEDREEFKDGATFLEFLKRLYNFYFLFTITGYPRLLEPNLPPLEQSIESFIRLSDILSRSNWERRVGEASPVVWRFDPIAISDVTGFEYNLDRFSLIAGKLRGACSRVITSFYDPYWKAEKRLKAEGLKISPIEEIEGSPGFVRMISGMKESARENGMEIFSCCESLAPYGIVPGKCIDDELILDLFGIGSPGEKDPHQREACRCVKSRDIGAYNTCVHGCKYCYATGDFEKARRRLESRDWLSPHL